MNDIILLYFFSFIIITIYAVCTLVNLWCLFVMAVLVFDVWFLDSTIRTVNKVNAYRRRRKFKLIKGKKNVD